MKLKIALTVLAVLIMTVFLSLVLMSCGKKLDKYSANISELRTAAFVGETDNFKVSAITGRRENPYILDGHCNGSRDFTVITVEPKTYDASAGYEYKAVINGVEYAGQLLPHPFGKSYSADIDKTCGTASISCKIISNGAVEETVLQTVVTEDMIDAEKAFDIALKRLKASLDPLYAGGRLNAEIYIRLMENPIDNSGGYKWYIAFIGESQTLYACLIDPLTMEVLAVRD